METSCTTESNHRRSRASKAEPLYLGLRASPRLREAWGCFLKSLWHHIIFQVLLFPDFSTDKPPEMTVDSTELRYQTVAVDDAEWWEMVQVPLQQQQQAPITNEPPLQSPLPQGSSFQWQMPVLSWLVCLLHPITLVDFCSLRMPCPCFFLKPLNSPAEEVGEMYWTLR